MRPVPRLRLPSRWTSRPAVALAAVLGLLLAATAGWAIPAIAQHAKPVRRAAASRVHVAAATKAASPKAAAAAVQRAAKQAKTKAKPKPQPNYIGVWSKSFVAQHPVNSDLIPPLLAVSSGGGVAVASGTTDENSPQIAKANLVTGTAHNSFGSRQLVTGAQQTLALAYRANTLNLLTGTSSGWSSCCSSAGVQTSNGQGFGAVQPIAGGLLGNSTGALAVVHSGMLALLGNQAGVWVSRSVGSTFGQADQLAGPDQTPPLVAATPLSGGGAVVAWATPWAGTPTGTGTTTTPAATTTTATTSTNAGQTFPNTQLIYYATVPAHAGALPSVHKLAVRVPENKQIDALSIAEHGSGATIAWTESWFGTAGSYASQAYWADLRGTGTRVHALSSPKFTAVGASIASGKKGRQVMTWQACNTAAGTCQVQAALRPNGGNWGPVQTLGPVDASSFPVAAASPAGAGLVGWISGGDVYAASSAPTKTVFNTPVELSRAGDDSQLALAYGSNSDAVAVWQQAVVHPEIVGARFDPLTYGK